MASPDITAPGVIDDLDSFCRHDVVVSLWADAMANRRADARAALAGR